MTCQEAVYQWQQTLQRHFPNLSRSQAYGLAMWSWGTVLCRSCSLSAVSQLYAQAWSETPASQTPASQTPARLGIRGIGLNSVRQRLREWYYPVERKRGQNQKRLEVEVDACFAPLLRWILYHWRGNELTLGLDATSLQDRFVVLCISVLYRGCALPVAWRVLPFGVPGAWRPHWLRLLELLGPAVPRSYNVHLLADRGLYSSWLYDAIVAQGWHPFLRINGGGTFKRQGQKHYEALGEIVKRLEGWGSVAGVAFQGAAALPCTLGVYWDKGCTTPWLILTDLPPSQCQASWYGARAWIEHGFKFTKSEGWQWQRSRIQDPERASRMWLVMAIATLWVVTQGSQQEDLGENLEPQDLIMSPSTRTISLFRRGWITQILALIGGKSLSWEFVLQPEKRTQPNLKRVFFDSS